MSANDYLEKSLPALRLAARSAVVAHQADIAGFVGPAFDTIAGIIGDNAGALDTPVAIYDSAENGMRVTVGYVYDGDDREGIEIVEVASSDRALCTEHHGPMDSITSSWQSLHEEIIDRGLTPSGPCREVYVRAYSEDQSDWVTELQQPVE